MPEERYKPATMILTDPDEKNEQKERKKEKKWMKELSFQVALRPAEAQTSA